MGRGQRMEGQGGGEEKDLSCKLRTPMPQHARNYSVLIKIKIITIIFFKKTSTRPGIVVHTVIPALGEAEQKDRPEFEVNWAWLRS